MYNVIFPLLPRLMFSRPEKKKKVRSLSNSKCLFGFTQKPDVSSLMWLCSLKYLVWHLYGDTDSGCIPSSLSLSVAECTTCVCIVTMQMINYRRAADTQCMMILMETSTSQHLCASPNIAAAPRSDHNLRLLLLPPHPLWFWLSTALLCAGAALTLPFANSSVVASEICSLSLLRVHDPLSALSPVDSCFKDWF